jgi:hypothetical protein
MAPRHGAGTEWIDKGSIRASIPARFIDNDRFMVFRYSGKLPMGGVRTGSVFHVLWAEGSLTRFPGYLF